MSPVREFLARYRVRLGFVAAVAAMWLATPTLGSVAVGGIIAAAGELFRIWAAGHLEKGREVTSSGPYRLTRHPLYAGSAAMGMGFAIASNSVWTAAITAAYLALTIGAAIGREEQHLTEKFGRAYPEYREGRLEGSRTFSLARAMRNREYRAAAGLGAVLALLLWKAL